MNVSCQPQLIGAFGWRLRPMPVFSPSKEDEVPRSSNGRVLIVEDEYFVNIEIERWLSTAGYDVIGVAVSAAEAIQLARIYLPDFILMDIRLVGARDGVDAALEIFANHNIRCLFASANVDGATRQRAQEAQPLGWLSKPYGQQDLVRAAEAAMKLSRR